MKTTNFALLFGFLVLVGSQGFAANQDRCQSKLGRYQAVRELSESEYRKITRNQGGTTLQGRFFEAQKEGRSNRQLLWMIPFADGEACVIRESVSLKKSIGV